MMEKDQEDYQKNQIGDSTYIGWNTESSKLICLTIEKYTPKTFIVHGESTIIFKNYLRDLGGTFLKQKKDSSDIKPSGWVFKNESFTGVIKFFSSVLTKICPDKIKVPTFECLNSLGPQKVVFYNFDTQNSGEILLMST